MKRTITEMEFVNGFADCGRGQSFSREGREAMFAWFEELDDSCGTETEYDPIAICCEFSEYDSPSACIEDKGYDCDLSECEDEDERNDVAIEWLNEQTIVIPFDRGTGLVIQDF